mgnify:CR=1 FL=1
MTYVRNIGTQDCTIRIIVGLMLVSLIFVGPKTLWGLLGIIPIATAIIGFCPPYTWLGINTNRKGRGQATT